MKIDTQFDTVVLIDGENIPAKNFSALNAKLLQHLAAKTIRVFGDFTNPGHSDWIDICRNHGVEAVLQLPTKAGKNTTDIVMAICAMDHMAAGRVTSIVLVSDDSDFVPLARRLQAGGVTTIGAGVKPLRPVMQMAYAHWVDIGNFEPEKVVAAVVELPTQDQKPLDPFPKAKFRKALLALLKNESLALSRIGSLLRESYPELFTSIGNIKLKKRIESDASFAIDGDMVRRKVG